MIWINANLDCFDPLGLSILCKLPDYLNPYLSVGGGLKKMTWFFLVFNVITMLRHVIDTVSSSECWRITWFFSLGVLDTSFEY